MSFSAPSDTFPLPMMCLEVRAMNLSYGDQAMRALCRARHTEYVQEPLSERKTKSILRNISISLCHNKRTILTGWKRFFISSARLHKNRNMAFLSSILALDQKSTQNR
jgi:hypothetical protein